MCRDWPSPHIPGRGVNKFMLYFVTGSMSMHDCVALVSPCLCKVWHGVTRPT
ncbi:MAG: hypothetical protein ACK55Z_23720 [bacterium]